MSLNACASPIVCALAFAAFAIASSTAVPAPAADAGAARLEWLGPIEIATGRGERGPWQQNESRYDYVDDPTVAITDAGEIAVAWVEQRRKDVFFQRLAPDGTRNLREPVNVSRSPETFSWLPRIVAAPNAPQTLYVIWQEIIFSGGSHGGDILFSRSVDGGETFSAPINLSDSIGGDGKGRINRDIWDNGSLDLAAGADGTLYAAWPEYDGPLWFSRSTDGGATFSRPQRVAGGGNAKPARAPALAAGPGRTVHLAWTIGEDDAADIRIVTSTDAGVSFDEPRIVAPSPGHSDAPKLAVDREGTVHLAYAESAGGPFDRHHIRYTRSTDGARSFDAPRDVSTPTPAPNQVPKPLPGRAPTAPMGAGYPALSIDSHGRTYVMWEIFQNRREPPRGLALAVSADRGRHFSKPAIIPGSIDPAGGFNGSHQGLLMSKLAVGPAGTVAVVNSSLMQDRRSRVWLMRGIRPE